MTCNGNMMYNLGRDQPLIRLICYERELRHHLDHRHPTSTTTTAPRAARPYRGLRPPSNPHRQPRHWRDLWWISVRTAKPWSSILSVRVGFLSPTRHRLTRHTVTVHRGRPVGTLGWTSNLFTRNTEVKQGLYRHCCQWVRHYTHADGLWCTRPFAYAWASYAMRSIRICFWTAVFQLAQICHTQRIGREIRAQIHDINVKTMRMA